MVVSAFLLKVSSPTGWAAPRAGDRVALDDEGPEHQAYGRSSINLCEQISFTGSPPSTSCLSSCGSAGDTVLLGDDLPKDLWVR